jgi:polyhydroxybutyrate depolymerase
MDWMGLERIYGLYVPSRPQVPAPLVFVLHGGGGSAAQTWDQDSGRSWRALADEHGFVLVFPQGRPDDVDADSHHWNDCRFTTDTDPIATRADDVGFVTRLIDVVSESSSIDPLRVYVTGASNGGMMTYRLAMEAGERFAAAAGIIANLPDPSECSSATDPIPMLIMNATEDPLMPFDGGCVVSSRCDRGEVMSSDETAEFWVRVNGASPEPIVERLPNRSWFDGSRVRVQRYEGGDDGLDVVYYIIEGGGHNIPGYERDPIAYRAIAGRKNRDIDGPTEIWAFFRSHSQ